MKSILSLILPDNRGTNISRRYLKNGRKAIGFQDRQLVVASPSGVENGIQSITADDLQEFTGVTATITRRVNRFSTQTATTAVTATLPAVNGELREVIIINANTSTTTLAVTGGTILGASTTVPDRITSGFTAHFLSNGTSWYRIV